MRFCFMREWISINYRYMQVHDFKRIKELKRLTGFPEFWIASRYWKLVDDNVGKTDEQLAELLIKQSEE